MLLHNQFHLVIIKSSFELLLSVSASKCLNEFRKYKHQNATYLPLHNRFINLGLTATGVFGRHFLNALLHHMLYELLRVLVS